MRLVEFLTMVVTDRNWNERFCRDPRRTLEHADLSPEAMRALRSSDPGEVARVICVVEAEER